MQPNITFATHVCSLLRCHRSYIIRYVEEKNETNNNISCYKNIDIKENIVKIVNHILKTRKVIHEHNIFLTAQPLCSPIKVIGN